MRSLFRSPVALTLAAALLLGPGTALARAAGDPATAAPVTPPPSAVVAPETVVVGLGDSLTWLPDSWFRQTCAAGVIGTCLDAGVWGNTTQQMLDRFDADVLGPGADVMVLMAGTNDMRQGASTARIVTQLKRLVARAQDGGIAVVVCTVPPRDAKGAGRKVLTLNAAIRKWAAAEGFPLLDMYAAVGTSAGKFRKGMAYDGLHPTRRGFTRMAAVSTPVLPGLVQRALAVRPAPDEAAPGTATPLSGTLWSAGLDG